MAGLLDFLGNMGATPPAYMQGLLGQDQMDKLKGQATSTGLANMVLGYLAAPKNQNLGLGRILGGAAQAGLQGAQGVYTNAMSDYDTQQKMTLAKRATDRQAQIDGMINSIDDPQQKLYAQLAPEQYVAGMVKPVPKDSPIAKLNPKDYTPESWSAYITKGNDTTQLRESNPSGSDVTNDRNAIAYANFGGKRFADLTPLEAQKVNTYLEQSKSRVVGAGVPSRLPSFTDATELRKEFKADPVIKNFSATDSAYKIIKSAIGSGAPTPAGDLAAVTKFMKILDPESVVRESEVGLAMGATGMYDSMTSYLKRMVTGEKLTPAQRVDFLNTATKFYNVARQQKTEVENQYAGIAKDGGLNPNLVTGSPRSNAVLNANDAIALNWANNHKDDPRAAQIKNKLGR
jgi:hypothetical protein